MNESVKGYWKMNEKPTTALIVMDEVGDEYNLCGLEAMVYANCDNLSAVEKILQLNDLKNRRRKI